jgi:phage baseplate assembly protein W
MDEYISHTIITGDTLISLASKYNISDWKTLAEFNDLDYPFIVSNKLDYPDKVVKSVGDKLLIPLSALTSKPDSVISLEAQYFGSDLKITNTDDVIFFDYKGELSAENGDLQNVEGVSNLMQSLVNRLMTPRGSLALHPDYGCDLKKILGKRATYAEITKAKLEVERTIKSDFRVKGVSSLRLDCYDRQVTINASISTKFGDYVVQLGVNI